MMETNFSLQTTISKICGLCGVLSENLDDLSKNTIFEEFQWISRKENSTDSMKIQNTCKKCTEQIRLLVYNVSDMWKTYLATQEMLQTYSDSSCKKDWNEFWESNANNLISDNTKSVILRDESIQFDLIANPVIKKEIESSVNTEGCTDIEWLIDTESSDSQTSNDPNLATEKELLKVLNRKDLLDEAYQNRLSKETELYKETECKETVTRTNNCGRTYKSTSPNYIIPFNGFFKCTICNETFSHRYKAEHHVRKQHTKERPFICKICSKGFMAAHNLNRHITCVHEPERFICEKCGRRFQKRYLLTAHELSHVGPPTIACSFSKCCKMFYSDSSLKMHIANSHIGLKFVCEQCGQAFRTKVRLTNHLRRHGDKIIKCPQCPKMFYIKTDLYLHMKYHNEKLPWRCRNCEMRFKSTRGLQNHLSVVHGKVNKIDLYKRNTILAIK